MDIVCLNCRGPYPDAGVPYKCPACGGLYDFLEPALFGDVDLHKPGIFRYSASLDAGTIPVSLGEGSTPLISGTAFGREVYFKCEYANPSGSFKDRGSAALVSFLTSRKITEAIEDSSGNAGASFAAYAARAGIKARVFVPEQASGPKCKQIELYGAELIPVPGPRSSAAEAARRAAEGGMVYASHAYLPFNLPGYATCAFEVVEQLRQVPGAVLIPAGQGGLLLGMSRGFKSMQRAGKIPRMPAIIGVQASVCAPLAALFEKGMTAMEITAEGQGPTAGVAATLAEGVSVRTPLRADAVVNVTRESGGRFVTVEEADILPGRDALAHLGSM